MEQLIKKYQKLHLNTLGTPIKSRAYLTIANELEASHELKLPKSKECLVEVFTRKKEKSTTGIEKNIYATVLKEVTD